ncbi:YqgU-like beta propeller domain-containing protein [Falsibacillus albus]|uniref:YqgU-like beta propeller domain-containing protein n=1 Tax=Falsibacillus albus TaxID=2478915 RepID=UPI0011E5BF4B|nr:hypothetical protein [Falsibacillus albus]
MEKGKVEEATPTELPQPHNEINAKKITPIPTEGFDKIVGWQDEQSIIFLYEEDSKAIIASYNLYSGQQKELYSTEDPVTDVILSPNGKMILAITSPYTYRATVHVISIQEPKILYSQDIDSFQLNVEWNRWDESSILITAFDQNWGFKVFLLNWNGRRLEPIDAPQPFLKWQSKSSLLAQDWDRNGQSLEAPIMSLDIRKMTEWKQVTPAAIHFDVFGKILMTITESSTDSDRAIYQFYDGDMKKLSSFTAPQISQYSDWLVPYYDLNDQTNELLTFVPYKSGVIDEYTEGFQLMKYSFDQGKQTIVVDHLDNEPLKCSPDGTKCLYGFQLEKLIDIKTNKITNLVQQ